ncbi:expressed protein [Phakopsora pachyrhizi]|uniref:Expressed protein n=1 Tax=Phakopsora pachyrhizi TaxID=170000 RepID=A0AAV0AJR4_PHAPC|nr:expressed protein [Phakopsora pachyrhizi]
MFKFLKRKVFAIPFPRPVGVEIATEYAPSFLLYTLPRAILEKPKIDPKTGKKEKEKFTRKIKRNWQSWIESGEEIRRNELQEIGLWKKFNGFVAQSALKSMRIQSNNTIELLGRLPSEKKMGKVTIIYPEPKSIPDWLNVANLNPDEIKKEIFKNLKINEKKTRLQKLISAVFLPFTLAIFFFSLFFFVSDIIFIVPLMLFEINLAYFILQKSRHKKLNILVKTEEKALVSCKAVGADIEGCKSPTGSIFEISVHNGNAFEKPIEFLLKLCSDNDDQHFTIDKDLRLLSSESTDKLANGFISLFLESVPDEVRARHRLNDRHVLDDLNQVMMRASKQYVKSLKLKKKSEDKK